MIDHLMLPGALGNESPLDYTRFPAENPAVDAAALGPFFDTAGLSMGADRIQLFARSPDRAATSQYFL